MKKIRVVLLFVVLCLLFTVATNAAESTFMVKELGMSITLPSDMVVFTRDIQDNDPNLAACGLTKSGMQKLMSDSNIYLNAWVQDVTYEIVVTMVESPFEDYNLFSDTTLKTLGTALKSEYENVGVDLETFELYQHEQAKFFVLNISQPNGSDTAYGLQYHTVYAGKAINVTLQSYDGKIDLNKEVILKEIVDGIRFETAPQKKDTSAPTAAFSYVDPLSGMKFTVPENWIKDDFIEEREFLRAKFTSNEEEGLSIHFGSEDVWSSLSESDKAGLSRKDLDNLLLTKSDYAEMCGCSEDDVEMVSFAGKEYYCAEVSGTEDVYGLTISVTITQYLRCENGYMYIFQFGGTHDSEYYDDFVSLMNSVVYPEITQEKPVAAPSSPENDKAGQDHAQKTQEIDSMEPEASAKMRPSAGDIVIGLLLTIVIYSIPIIVYRYGIRKAPVEKKKAKRITIVYAGIAFVAMSAILYFVFENGIAGSAIIPWSVVNYTILSGGRGRRTKNVDSSKDMMAAKKDPVCLNPVMPAETKYEEGKTEAVLALFDTADQETEIMFCHKCGSRLLPDSLYCSRCGTKVHDGGDR